VFLKKLIMANFRNYGNLNFEPSEMINVLYGFNAQGKTNLLEAIYCLATGHSHRSKDVDLIHWGEPYSKLKGIIKRGSEDTELEVSFETGGQKNLKVDGIKQTRQPDYLGNLSVVLFSPEDLSIIKGGPKERRRFLDVEISQISRSYAYLLLQYYKVLGQRNTLLKSFRTSAFNNIQLEIWDEQLVELGSKILKKRFEMVRKLSSLGKNKHLQITAGKESLEIKYYCSLQVKPDFTIAEIGANYSVKLKEIRQEELNRGSTLVGPHRDDLVFYINGIDGRVFGSQGQQRTTALSLKLAELELIYGETREYPVLLLDDVLSELDNLRRHYLLAAVKQKIQTFVTTTNLEYIDQQLLTDAKVFRVDEGKLIYN